jgi:phosphoribosylglycinamide formyltransferase-1
VKQLAILISGRGSNMDRLSAACADGGLAARVAAVIADRPDAPGLALAQGRGLRAEVLDHRGFASREAFDRALVERLEACGADIVVLAGFMRVLGAAVVDRFAGRLVNVHPSLLPSFPGLRTHARALAAGVRVHGATVHLVTGALDHGPILAQAVVPVRDDDDVAALAERVLQAEHVLLPRAVRWMAEGRVRVVDGRALVEGVPAAERRLAIGFD